MPGLRAEGIEVPTTETELARMMEREVAQRIGKERYELWFAGRTRFSPTPGQLVLGVANRICLEMLKSKFRSAIVAASRAVYGRDVPLQFEVDAEVAKESAPASASEPPKDETSSEKAPARVRRRRWRKLEDFVVGPCNRVAHASAAAVVEAPGEEANPLVLFGGVGTGKTHLLEGIYVGLRKRHPGWRVRFLSGEDFTNRFLQALRTKRIGDFRRYLRDCDALLLDDLHFLGGKQKTQEEFLYTLDNLQSDGSQVVVTCDIHPRSNDKLLPELIDRLVGGVALGIAPPDYDTRLNLLRSRAGRFRKTLIDDSLLAFLADELRGNARELEGAINSLIHHARVVQQPITPEMAREVLREILHYTDRTVRLADIDAAVCRVLRLTKGTLQKKERRRACSHPRMIAMFLARKHTTASYNDIGRHFGGRSHCTVINAEKTVRRWLAADHRLECTERAIRVRDVIEQVERLLFG